MLQVLRGHKLEGVIAVVVRYYGGVLLGVGGLIELMDQRSRLRLKKRDLLAPRKYLRWISHFRMSLLMMWNSTLQVLERF